MSRIHRHQALAARCSIIPVCAALASLLSIIPIASSCTSDNDVQYKEPTVSDTSLRMFANVAVNPPATKADASETLRRIIPLDEGLALYEYVSDYKTSGSDAKTKGTISTTQNLGSLYGGFAVNGFLGDGAEESNRHFIDDCTVIYQNESWKWNLPDERIPLWRNETSTLIWSHAPMYPEGNLSISFPEDGIVDPTDEAYSNITFTYELPGSGGQEEFKATEDLILAFNKEQRRFDMEHMTSIDGQPNTFNVYFSHALSAVTLQEDRGSMQASSYTIKQVSLDGIYRKGQCEANATNGSIHYSWAVQGERGSISELPSGGYTADDTNVLFMIPQDLDGVSLTVRFLKHGLTVRRSIPIDDPGISWEAGKIYRYVIKATIHVPGEEILLNSDFNIKGFKNAGGTNEIGPFEIIGVKKIGIVLNHNYRENSGWGEADFFLQSQDGLRNTKDQHLTYDFLPVPLREDWPYKGGDGRQETYNGLNMLENEEVTGDSYFVYDVTGYKYFNVVCHSSSGANDGRWSGTFKKIYVLEVEGYEP